MATVDEIERRVEEADTARSERRSAAAKRVSELAQRRATLAEQLSDIERELGDVLAESSDVIEIDELVRFTDVPAADLTRWLDGQKTTRAKRRKPAGGASSTKTATSRRPSITGAPTAGEASTLHGPPAPRDSTANTPMRAAAHAQ